MAFLPLAVCGSRPLVQSTPGSLSVESYTALQTNFLVGGGFRLGRQSMIKALRASLERLGQQKTDLYQV